MPVPFLPEAELVLVCDLVGGKDVPRMPPRIGENDGARGGSAAHPEACAFRGLGPTQAQNGALAGDAGQCQLGGGTQVRTPPLPTKITAVQQAEFDPRDNMIGVVIVTHGRLAHEFRAALEHVVGPQEQIETISIGPDDDLDVRRSDMLTALARVDSGKGVVVLTDMFGGTPSNLAISAMERSNVEVIAGVNLPMLVKLASVRGECKLQEAITQAQEAGRKYISVASQILAAN